MCMILFESGEFCAFYGVVRYTLQWVQKLSSQLPVAGTARFLQGARIDGFLGGYWHPNTVSGATSLVVAKTPTSSLTLDAVQRQNNAPQLCHSLELYLRRRNPEVRLHEIRQLVPPTTKVNTWSRARLFHAPPPFKPSEGPHVDAVRAQPVKLDRFERVSRPARFDTVLIRSREQRTGVHRYRPARVRAIFQLPRRLSHLCDEKLVHVELFNSPSQNPNPPVGLYTTTRSIQDGIRSTLVVPLVDIAMTCHLAPRYSHFHPQNQLIQYADLLQLCEHFYLNIFASYFLYELFQHWGQAGGSAA
ncbi:hypothetical protein RhiJN_13941 [Ceratobasidium sp. AG-Ba]|nr:hypothetical protein RhiJN_13941 [Ceratobasidium sp. AG-Ba]QRW14499.1 hypothetical protein RhiLY_13498 [Ceratobasidium sp. AG-Ba]